MNVLNTFIRRKKNSQTYSFTATREERDELCTTIINSSSLRSGFYLLLILSTFIVSVGLIKNNLILIIGGMLVAPLLSPILSISLSLAIVNLKTFFRSILVFLISALASLLTALFIGLIAELNLTDIELLSLMANFDAATLLIPLAAGAAASFTWVKKDLSGALPGVAITVTLMPPLAVMGLALAQKAFLVFQDALLIYLLNVAGIILGSLIIFLFMGFYQSSKTVIKQVELESENKL